MQKYQYLLQKIEPKFPTFVLKVGAKMRDTSSTE